MHKHMHAIMYKCIHLHANMYRHMHAIVYKCIPYACTHNGVQGYVTTITITTPGPFYSAAWKREILTLQVEATNSKRCGKNKFMKLLLWLS